MAKPEPDLSYIREDIRSLAVPIKRLKLDPRNARNHQSRSLEAIQLSLAKFGQCKPVVINRQTMQVVAGNGMLQAAKNLKWTHLAVVRVEPDEHAGYALADNRHQRPGESAHGGSRRHRRDRGRATPRRPGRSRHTSAGHRSPLLAAEAPGRLQAPRTGQGRAGHLELDLQD